MENIIARLNVVLPIAANALEKRHAILLFILDFASIHPFGDANGRVMCRVCDLLLIKEKVCSPSIFAPSRKKAATGYTGRL